MTEESGSLQVPKKLKRTMKKLAEAGEELVQIAPAILQSQATDQMMAIARLGMMDKIIGYLVTTKTNVHFVRPGLAWDKVQTVPLEKIDGIEYVNEFHNNTLSLNVGGRSEKIIFYDDMDGIKFYHFIKNKKLQN